MENSSKRYAVFTIADKEYKILLDQEQEKPTPTSTPTSTRTPTPTPIPPAPSTPTTEPTMTTNEQQHVEQKSLITEYTDEQIQVFARNETSFFLRDFPTEKPPTVPLENLPSELSALRQAGDIKPITWYTPDLDSIDKTRADRYVLFGGFDLFGQHITRPGAIRSREIGRAHV